MVVRGEDTEWLSSDTNRPTVKSINFSRIKPFPLLADNVHIDGLVLVHPHEATPCCQNLLAQGLNCLAAATRRLTTAGGGQGKTASLDVKFGFCTSGLSGRLAK